MTWLETIESMSVEQLLRILNVEFRRGRLAPCPSCREVKHSSDSQRIGPVGFGRDSWQCHRCQVKGGTIELASWLVLGQAKVKGCADFWKRFEEAWSSRTGLGSDAPMIRLPPPTGRPPSARPPIAEVREVWNASKPVTDDPEIFAWLESRGLLPHAVQRRDLARALPEDYWCPRWASYCGTQWSKSGHRLIFRVVGPSENGWEWSLRARNIKSGVPSRDKSASVAMGAGSASGLIHADDHARKMLIGNMRNTQIIITEGEPDWLTWTTREVCDLQRQPWGVIGIWNGAWRDEMAELFPRGSTVAIRGHRDTAASKFAGQKMMKRIARSLLPRGVSVHVIDGEGPDENDQLRFGGLEYDPLHGCRRVR